MPLKLLPLSIVAQSFDVREELRLGVILNSVSCYDSVKAIVPVASQGDTEHRTKNTDLEMWLPGRIWNEAKNILS